MGRVGELIVEDAAAGGGIKHALMAEKVANQGIRTVDDLFNIYRLDQSSIRSLTEDATEKLSPETTMAEARAAVGAGSDQLFVTAERYGIKNVGDLREFKMQLHKIGPVKMFPNLQMLIDAGRVTGSTPLTEVANRYLTSHVFEGPGLQRILGMVPPAERQALLSEKLQAQVMARPMVVVLDKRPPLQQIRAWLPTGGLVAFTGAWGMVTGFALFIAAEENIHHWWIPFGAVILATIAAAVVEWLRARAEGHTFRRPALSRMLSFFVLLAVFELFIYAFHDLMKDLTEWGDTAKQVFGATSFRGVFNLAVFVCLWTLLAARVASAIADAVARMPHVASREELIELDPELGPSIEDSLRWDRTRESLWIGLKAGLRVAVVSIPLIVLSYAVVVRLGWATFDYLFTGEWRLPDGETWFTYLVTLLLVGAIAGAVSERSFLLAIYLAIYFGINIFRWFHSGTAEVLTSFAWQLWRTVLLAVEIAAIWVAPAIVLGVLAPFLRKPSNYPWLWSLLALAAAAVSMVLVFLQGQPILLLVAGLLFVSGLLLRTHQDRLEELWPLLAASVAIMAALAAAVVLNLTPFAMYRNIEAAVIPQPLKGNEMTYVNAMLAAVDLTTCPSERIAKYDEILENVGRPQHHPKADAVAALVAIPNREAMRTFIEERRDLERAVLEGKLLTTCDGKDRSRETRPFTRAMSFALATISSLSFWVTLGLLAVWQMRAVRAARYGWPLYMDPSWFAR